MKIVFATNNLHKVKEVQEMLPQDIELLTLAQVNINEDIPEDYPTLEGNALQKARYIFEKYGYSCFADDTGLEVAALDNEPGVYSARYAGEQKSSEDNIDKELAKLGNSSNRKVDIIGHQINRKEERRNITLHHKILMMTSSGIPF